MGDDVGGGGDLGGSSGGDLGGASAEGASISEMPAAGADISGVADIPEDTGDFSAENADATELEEIPEDTGEQPTESTDVENADAAELEEIPEDTGEQPAESTNVENADIAELEEIPEDTGEQPAESTDVENADIAELEEIPEDTGEQPAENAPEKNAKNESSNEQVDQRYSIPREIEDSILDAPQGERPDPSTYLPREYIDAHLKHFDNGATKFAATMPEGRIGPPGGTFVMPKSDADALLTETGGNIDAIEDRLGKPPGSYKDGLIRVDFDNPQNLRMPSGNEMGAKELLWHPGGYTINGVREAIINPTSSYTTTRIR